MAQHPPIRITLSGDLGSGKSSVGKRLAAALDVPYFSAGAMFRDLGKIDNLDALRTNLAAENNTAIDYAVDSRTREIDGSVPSFVIDSRMAWHFVGNALKVFLSVSRDTAAHRIMGDGARGSETYPSHAAAVTALGERRQSEIKRYRQLYGVDIADASNYDLYVITDDASLSDLTELVLAAARGTIRAKHWLPKPRLVPMMPWAELPPPSAAPSRPLPLTIVHNFGFYSSDPAALAALGDANFAAYVPEAPPAEPEKIVARAKRTLTPGGLGKWVQRAAIGRAFCDLLEPARP